MSFTVMKVVHRCLTGCGAVVSRRRSRCAVCHGRYVGVLRTPEDRARIATIASEAAARARTARALLPRGGWSATSRLL